MFTTFLEMFKMLNCCFNRKFYGYKSHFAYLDYFVKTDVSKRDGTMHV
jgi:hypothetical protein